jgi:CubicO group peptidase (beta-lactamase class C family)
VALKRRSAPAFPVAGDTVPGFEKVLPAFSTLLAREGELGAALCVMIDGRIVVDLWGGPADAAGTRPWTADTLVNVWSATKGAVALATHILADEGLLDLDAPVAHYWPEFARRGKGAVLVRQVLSHTAGIPAPSSRVPREKIYDWGAMIAAIEDSELFWEPGTRMGYHAATFGWILGEILRRVAGLTFGEFLRARVSGPLGVDVRVGLSPEEESRAAEIKGSAPLSGPAGDAAMRAIITLGGRVRSFAIGNPPRPYYAANEHRWRAAQIPSSNGHASARGLARLYAPLALGGEAFGARVLSAEALGRAAREEERMKDIVTGRIESRSLGFMLPLPGGPDPRPAGAFGHLGKGGSMGFAEPGRRLSFGFVANAMRDFGDGRWEALYRAVRACMP